MFSSETTQFLADLKDHNDGDWFQSHKRRYEAHVKSASKTFSEALEMLLSERYGVAATAKLYRINRDLRFSKDKTPYNAHVHLSVRDPAADAAWMIGLKPDRLVLGYGAFAFDTARLARWRERVAGPAGERLMDSLGALDVRLDEPELKRPPSPFAPEHPRADLLRRKEFAVWHRDLPVEEAFGPDAPIRVLDRLVALGPVRDWMASELGKLRPD